MHRCTSYPARWIGSPGPLNESCGKHLSGPHQPLATWDSRRHAAGSLFVVDSIPEKKKRASSTKVQTLDRSPCDPALLHRMTIGSSLRVPPAIRIRGPIVNKVDVGGPDQLIIATFESKSWVSTSQPPCFRKHATRVMCQSRCTESRLRPCNQALSSARKRGLNKEKAMSLARAALPRIELREKLNR